jgi:Mn-dependent DtxR family transcriptional regulator
VTAQVLIDALVQQFTVLTAQIATSGGLRAPIAHIANQVFVELSRELQSQGVGRKVSADMFGMALRAYQRKLKRLSTRSDAAEHRLWDALLALLERGSLEREALLEHFASDDQASVTAVLRDLCDAGLVTASGRGARALYARAEREAGEADQERGMAELLWVSVHRGGPVSASALAERLRLPLGMVATKLEALAREGRLERHGERYESHDFSVPLGSESGWEAAVLDHVQAVVQTISQRLLLGPVVPKGSESVGGSTFRFDVWEGHPLLDEVRASLSRFRAEHARLRDRVQAHNQAHGRPDRYEQVVVYGGQCSFEREKVGGRGDAS